MPFMQDDRSAPSPSCVFLIVKLLTGIYTQRLGILNDSLTISDSKKSHSYITLMNLPPPAHPAGSTHEESPMKQPCPQCGSRDVISSNHGRRVGGVVGTVAGAFSGATAATTSGARAGMKVGAAGGPVGVGAGAVLGAIAGALAGCVAGLQLGKVVDQQVICSYLCLDCQSRF